MTDTVHSKLEKLLGLLVDCMLDELTWYMEQDPPIPVPAADKAVMAKLLRDNEITAIPAAASDLDKLREELKNKAHGSRASAIKEIMNFDDAPSELERLYPN